MYVCGPTVYDKAHLGNARPAVVFDILYRLLKILYSKVTYVRNITDIDDKIYKTAILREIGIKELTNKTIRMYHEDMAAINVLKPDIEPKATEHIGDIIRFIERLIENKNAYIVNDHVYFDVTSFAEYGKLAGKNIVDLQSGSRIEISANKKNPLDFVLWKPIDEEFNIGWDSPFGIGRPGWHIECSAMSAKYLGGEFDIHGGGIDLIFPHHENEIAQSCSLFQKATMAKYWIHNGHLNVDGTKMSKSLGNFSTIQDLLEKYDGEVIRFVFLMTHYSSPINFDQSMLDQAKNILDRWYNSIKNILYIDNFDTISYDVFEALLDNMNTPLAISRMYIIVDELNKQFDNEKANILVYTARKFLGVLQKTPDSWFRSTKTDSVWIQNLIEQRNIAKKNRDFETSDRIRKILMEEGIILEDTKSGTSWKKI
jgi:cysteinyl-tRNA synthetase